MSYICSNCSANLAGQESFCESCGTHTPTSSNFEIDTRKYSVSLFNAIASRDFFLALSLLPESEQAAYQAELQRRRKKVSVGYLYCFLLGIFGAHKFYMQEPRWGGLYLCCMLLDVGVIIFAWIAGSSPIYFNNPQAAAQRFFVCYAVAAVCNSIVGIGLLSDIFCIPHKIFKANDRIRQDILIKTASRLHPS